MLIGGLLGYFLIGKDFRGVLIGAIVGLVLSLTVGFVLTPAVERLSERSGLD